MESDNDVTEMLEVPGHFQKPHQIFISEQADWSFENSAQEETDPLCIEEDQDGKNLGGGEKRPTVWPPVKNRVIKEEPVKRADVNFPPLDLTVKREKGAADSPPSDGFRVSAIPHVKEIHHSTVVTSDSTGIIPASERAIGVGTVKAEPSSPLPPYVSYVGNTGPGSSLRDGEGTAAFLEKEDDDEVEVVPHNPVVCPAHARKRIVYSQMLTMAIMDSPNWRISLREIYRYTRRNFPCVRYRNNWENSIRHILSISPLFVKAQRTPKRNAHYWSVVPSFADTLRENFSSPNQYCCKWQLVNRLQRHCTQTLPRKRPPQYAQGRLCEPSTRCKTSKSSSSTRKKTPHSSSGDSRRVGPRKPQRPNLATSVAHFKTETRDELDWGSEDFLGHAPPLKPLIARAIMLSPYRHVPLSVIYAYCIRHCPYYKNYRWQCQMLIKSILASEACFKRLSQEDDNRTDYWTFDMRYKDLLERDTCKPPGDDLDAAYRNIWEHDHGLYPKRLESHLDETDSTGQCFRPVSSPDSQLTDTASESGSDTDEVPSLLQGLSQSCPPDTGRSGGGATNGNRSTIGDGGSGRGCSPKQTSVCDSYLETLPRHKKQHSGYLFVDQPTDVLDIKEEPLPEELPMVDIYTEENGEQTPSMCTTLLDADVFRPVKIKQEKDEYLVPVKYEMVDTLC
ncbi:uncharacterized protein LOC124720416 isoform X1 [Schistocerca piceifrons]|uniref:uncharacterized protein LOC124720416 isoform X1 n=1 Tax=Schistocerca piceifrons TaxID=274613 RepID=UPI001F5FEF85|nr:uncharacterized protein LOC124720416 isoform X1 [Schistocerca piceifrons]XP_047101722.1 uncharacterized protein LOC124720416 isoform X1 [Schistocerca piceifrons]